MPINYCHSLFHRGAIQDPKVLNTFLENSISGNNAKHTPQAALAIAGICIERVEDADRLRAAHDNEFIQPTIIGTPAHCQDKILTLATVYGVTEIIWMDLSPTRYEQKQSLTRLARQMGMAE